MEGGAAATGGRLPEHREGNSDHAGLYGVVENRPVFTQDRVRSSPRVCPVLQAKTFNLPEVPDRSRRGIPDGQAFTRHVVVMLSNSVLRFPPFISHGNRLNLPVTKCYGVREMLAVFLIVCPIGIAALFGFARHVDPLTGQFKR